MANTSSSIIAEDQIRQFSRNGFVVIDHFLDLPEIQNLIRSCEGLVVDDQSSRTRRGVEFARRNLLEHPFVHELIAHPRVRALLEALAAGVIPVRSILFDKNLAANWTVPWHQDRSIAVREKVDVAGFGPWSTKAGVVHVQPPVEILQRMITLRLHLDPCADSNGPLRVIPATHERILDQQQVEEAVAHREQLLCTTGAGGLVVMRPLILHASSPAQAPSHRRVIHIEFAPAELPGGLRWAMAPEMETAA